MVATLSRSIKSCVLRLSPDKVCFVISERANVGGINIWCELSQVGILVTCSSQVGIQVSILSSQVCILVSILSSQVGILVSILSSQVGILVSILSSQVGILVSILSFHVGLLVGTLLL